MVLALGAIKKVADNYEKSRKKKKKKAYEAGMAAGKAQANVGGGAGM